MDNRRIVVIGSGIAALSTIFELNKNGFNNILCLSSEGFAPGCSYASTGINALRGTESGLSPLGDILIASHKAFDNFNREYLPHGVAAAREIHAWYGENSKLTRRYKTFNNGKKFNFSKVELTKIVNYRDSHAFVISPGLLLRWLEDNSTYEHVEDFITSVQDTKVIGQVGVYSFDHLIICSGLMARNFIDLVQDDAVRKNLYYSKAVSGAYIEFDSADFKDSNLCFDESFSFVFENSHLIFRADLRKVIIGSTSENNKLNFLADKTELRVKYEKLKSIIGGEFPHFDKALVFSGVRHKTQNREPFWGEISTNISAIWGLYKTGWSMSFLASRDIVSTLKLTK
jgi:hypothetical protein